MKRATTPKKSIEWDISETKFSYMMNTLFLSDFKSSTLSKNMPNTQSFLMSRSAKINTFDKNDKIATSQRQRLSAKKAGSSLSKYPENRQSNILSKPQKSSLRPRSSITTRSHQKASLNKSQDKIQVKFVLAQTNTDPPLQPLSKNIEKSMFSSKALGIVKAYGVNSHKFYMNPYQPSEARVCIISNLTKTSHKDRIISYFSLFEGGKSSLYLDFLREYLHVQLAENLSIIPPKPINEELILKCIKKIEKKYRECNAQKKAFLSSEFDISFGMVFTYKSKISIITKGAVKVFASMGFGSKKTQISSSKLKLTEITPNEQLDHIFLSSEGINTSKSLQKVNQLIWKIFMMSLFTQQSQKSDKISLHQMIGLTVDSMMEMFSTTFTAKNISLILVAFENMNTLLNPPKDELELPYVEAGM